MLAMFALLVAVSAVGALMGASAKLRRLGASGSTGVPVPASDAGAVELGRPGPGTGTRGRPPRGRLAVPLASGMAVLAGVVGGFVVVPLLGSAGEDSVPSPSLSPAPSASGPAYVVAYRSIGLVVDKCGGPGPVDLQWPRLVSDSKAQMQILLRCETGEPVIVSVPALNGGQPVPRSQSVIGARVASADMSPGECAAAVRTSPLPDGEWPVSQGDVYCLDVVYVPDGKDDFVHRVVLLEIHRVTAEQVSIVLTAWDVQE
ncbi:hypothetical protein [Actinoplanes campanulatus]|uniref:hypothetical protein n=1 Tax=Actinoplanes campanulatus TaxID=113559 RepID=UPI0019534297|nr:hypothetical protein [Actinoplanes capillaceus]